MKFLSSIALMILFCAGCSAVAGQADSETTENRDSEQTASERRDADVSFSVISSGFRDAVALDYTRSDNRLYVIESGRNRLLTLDPTGRRTDSLGSRGSGDYRFDRPSAIDATNGLRIYIADRQNNRIQLYDRRLSFLSTIKPPSDRQGINPVFFSPAAVSVNAFDDIHVYDADSDQILIFDRNGRYQSLIALNAFDIELPIRTLITHEDRLFLLENERGLIHELSSRGGYRGFTAGAPDVRAMFFRDQRIWAASAEKLYVINLEGRVERSMTHDFTETINGLAVSRNRIYILGPNGLSAADIR